MEIQREWTEIAMEIEASRAGSDMRKAVSLRLDYVDLAHVDCIAEHLGQSRQWVLSLMIGQVLSNAVRGLADCYEQPEGSAGFLFDMNQKVQEKATSMASSDGVDLTLKGWSLKTVLNPDEVDYLKKRQGNQEGKS